MYWYYRKSSRVPRNLAPILKESVRGVMPVLWDDCVVLPHLCPKFIAEFLTPRTSEWGIFGDRYFQEMMRLK